MEFDTGLYECGGDGPSLGVHMGDLDTLDELKRLLELYAEVDEHKAAVKQVIKRIEDRITQIVKDAIL